MNHFMKVLIGYDGSDYSNNALDDLLRAGLPAAGAALVVTVADRVKSSIPDDSDLDALGTLVASRLVEKTVTLARRQAAKVYEKARELAKEGASRAQSALPGWQIAYQPLMGSPATELLQKAADWEADLIVAGSHGRSAVGRFFLGSVSQRIARQAACSVRIVHSKTQRNDDGALRLIAGVNNSPETERVIQVVAQRQWAADSKIRLISVDDGVSAKRISAVLPSAERMFERAEERLAAAGLAVSVEIKCGDIAAVLLDEARRWNADSLFVPAKGLSDSAPETEIDEAASALAVDARCPVEIVR